MTRWFLVKLPLVAILAVCIVYVFVIPQRQIRAEHERHKRVADDIRALNAQLNSYKDSNGAYPASLSELKNVGNDAWGQKYIYRVPGLHNRDDYDLFSAGPDHTPDTLDDDWGD